MNADQIIRLAMQFLRPLINRGINAGIDRAVGRGKPPAEMTSGERTTARQSKEMVRRARQMARATRRIGRF